MLHIPPPTADDAVPCPHADSAEHDLRLLGELNEIGMDMARVCGRRVLAQEQIDEAGPGLKPAVRAAELSGAYERIARSIRLTVMLRQRLRDGTLTAELEAADARRAKDAERAEALRERKQLAFHAVREAIQRQPTERPERDTEDKLDGLDILFLHADIADAHFETGPISGLIANLCSVLGVEPDWTLWAGETWAVTEMVARIPGPYREWRLNALRPDGSRGPAPPLADEPPSDPDPPPDPP